MKRASLLESQQAGTKNRLGICPFDVSEGIDDAGRTNHWFESTFHRMVVPGGDQRTAEEGRYDHVAFTRGGHRKAREHGKSLVHHLAEQLVQNLRRVATNLREGIVQGAVGSLLGRKLDRAVRQAIDVDRALSPQAAVSERVSSLTSASLPEPVTRPANWVSLRTGPLPLCQRSGTAFPAARGLATHVSLSCCFAAR